MRGKGCALLYFRDRLLLSLTINGTALNFFAFMVYTFYVVYAVNLLPMQESLAMRRYLQPRVQESR